jgi:hypothetical protein
MRWNGRLANLEGETRLRACCCQGKGSVFGKPRHKDEHDMVASSTRPEEQPNMLFYE